jgi:hypothetical protein
MPSCRSEFWTSGKSHVQMSCSEHEPVYSLRRVTFMTTGPAAGPIVQAVVLRKTRARSPATRLTICGDNATCPHIEVVQEHVLSQSKFSSAKPLEASCSG